MSKESKEQPTAGALGRRRSRFKWFLAIAGGLIVLAVLVEILVVAYVAFFRPVEPIRSSSVSVQLPMIHFDAKDEAKREREGGGKPTSVAVTATITSPTTLIYEPFIPETDDTRPELRAIRDETNRRFEEVYQAIAAYERDREQLKDYERMERLGKIPRAFFDARKPIDEIIGHFPDVHNGCEREIFMNSSRWSRWHDQEILGVTLLYLKTDSPPYDQWWPTALSNVEDLERSDFKVWNLDLVEKDPLAIYYDGNKGQYYDECDDGLWDFQVAILREQGGWTGYTEIAKRYVARQLTGFEGKIIQIEREIRRKD
jgi:hypothetical protein